MHNTHTHTHTRVHFALAARERGVDYKGRVCGSKRESTSTTPSLDEALPDALPPPAPAQHAAESRRWACGTLFAAADVRSSKRKTVQLCDAATVTLQAKEGIL